jgi:hypothetical protein
MPSFRLWRSATNKHTKKFNNFGLIFFKFPSNLHIKFFLQSIYND